ncbi:hypothetical protein C8R45DRAFT_890811 [Mycena sanguinolenta]|nr:hypothetical protein C8R45DRAFT_890811 [Mycena sanguinolenta]
MSKLLTKIVNPTYPIVIAQYERDDYSVGNEEHLRWALMVVRNSDKLRGPIFQAIDRLYYGGTTATWERSYLPEGDLLKTTKCIGLIQIGSVKARDLDSFIAMVGDSDPNKGHPVIPKFQGWRCKDWILEVIDLLKQNSDWIDNTLVPHGQTARREMFLPALRRAGKATAEVRAKDRKAPPAAEWL